MFIFILTIFFSLNLYGDFITRSHEQIDKDEILFLSSLKGIEIEKRIRERLQKERIEEELKERLMEESLVIQEKNEKIELEKVVEEEAVLEVEIKKETPKKFYRLVGIRNRLNIRKEPIIGNNKIGFILAKAKNIEHIECKISNKKEWCKVRYNNKVGWVSKRFLKEM